MSFRVTLLPSQSVFEANPGETLLDAASRQGLRLPENCREGTCGACRARIVSGEVEHDAVAEDALPAADRAAGFALLCSARARSDLVLACREVAAGEIAPRIFPARVQRLELLAEDVMAIFLKLPEGSRLDFRAGQYVDILLRDGQRRSFSLANAPYVEGVIELHVRRIAGGTFTEHVFTGMKERDIVRLSGPHGDFWLREDSPKPAILLASGTGFAPVKSMIEHVFHSGLRKKLHLYWGARRRADLYLDFFVRNWAAEYPALKYTPVLSEAAPSDAWSGRQGFVHRALVEDYPDLSGHQVYACGLPAMVGAAQRDLTTLCRLPDEEFFSDAFHYSSKTDRGLPHE